MIKYQSNKKLDDNGYAFLSDDP